MRHLFVAATLAAALPFAGLPGQFEKIAPTAKGRVGVAVELLESGETASLHDRIQLQPLDSGCPYDSVQIDAECPKS